MISLDKVFVRYPGTHADALRDISVSLPDGSFTAVMGANGSGKSTLARCLNGLLLPSRGTVTIDGMRTEDAPSLPAIRRSVGLVFQDPNLQMTSATVERELAFGLQNLGVPPHVMHDTVERELQRLQMTDRKTVPPALLSGGEKLRLVLAATLLLKPRHLVLDEPTSFLAPSSRVRHLELLADLRKETNTTIVLITQFPHEAFAADRLLLLGNGRLVFDGFPAEVRNRTNYLSSLGIHVPRSSVP